MENLKQKTINGLVWSFIDGFASQGIQFLAGIILARMLSPREFGLIGMLGIFIAISQSFIDSGFSNALIRKKNCTSNDYSTVFYFNILVSLFFFILLYLCADIISEFFKEPQLKILVQIISISLVLNSISIIHRTILTKELNFKLQTHISIIASLLSGIISIWMAYNGFGIWSLVALTMSRFAITSLLFWLKVQWKPSLVFSEKSFKELFSFGSKLLLSGLIDTLYRNIYFVVIGKYFSAIQLGYYTRADQFQALPSQNLNLIISKVSFPVLSKMQDDIPNLKISYQKLVKGTMFLTFVLMLFLAAISKPLILLVLGEKWAPSIIYLQLLCFVGTLFPLHALNLNILQVLGRSDLFLRLEIIKKIIAIPLIFIAILWGIQIMIISTLFIGIITFFINSYWSGRLIKYSSFDQIKDITPSLIVAVVANLGVYILGEVTFFPKILLLLSQVTLGAVLTIFIAERIHLDSYCLLKRIFLEKIRSIVKTNYFIQK